MALMRRVLLVLIFVGLGILVGVWDYQTEDVIVAVIDTGVDYNHPWLKGNTVDGFDFVDFDFDAMDENGHGTHVAGIIQSKAPGAKILPVRILNEKATGGYFSSVGILYSIFKGADVINMSFSEKENPFTKLAIKFGEAKGVIFVGSSGNEREQKINFPASMHEVIAVGAMNPEKNSLYRYSNIGEELDYVAPGVNIMSADLDNSYTRRSGTSMAAPYISGAIAYLKLHSPDMSEKDIQTILEVSSRHFSRNYLLKYLDFKKLKATNTDETYLHVEEMAHFYNTNKVTFEIDCLNANFILLYDNGQIIQVWENVGSREDVYLKGGLHHLTFEAYGATKVSHSLNLVIDTEPPKIDYKVTENKTSVIVKMEVMDETLTNVILDGRRVNPVSIRKDFGYVFVEKVSKSEGWPLTISAHDKYGRQTTRIIKLDNSKVNVMDIK